MYSYKVTRLAQSMVAGGRVSHAAWYPVWRGTQVEAKLRSLQKEIRLMERLSHPNIVR